MLKRALKIVLTATIMLALLSWAVIVPALSGEGNSFSERWARSGLFTAFGEAFSESVHRIGLALQEVHWGWLLGALFFTVFHYVLRAWRWRLLMSPIRPALPLRPLLDAVLAGYAVTFLIPGRVGEVFRPAYLARKEKLPFGSTLTTVGLDRLLDAAAIATLLVTFLLIGPTSGLGALAPEHAESMRQRGLVAAGGLVVLFGVLWLVARQRQRVLAWGRGAAGWRGRLHGMFDSILEGLAVLADARGFLGAVAWSLVIWLVLCSQVWCGVQAFGIELPWVSSFAVIPFLALGIAVPLPGGVGGYHAAGAFVLINVLGAAADASVAAIFVLHVVSVIPAILLGGWVIAREGVSIRELLRSSGVGRSSTGGPDAPPEPLRSETS